MTLVTLLLTECSTYPAVVGEEDGVALDVSVDHTLRVEDRQRLQDGQADRGDLLLVHPAEQNRTERLTLSC